LLTAKTETPHSLLWLAAIQIVERKQNLPGLTPKSSFITTEAVESIIGQIAEPHDATQRNRVLIAYWQIIATRAPDLGWSPESKQMIASFVQQLGWTKPQGGQEITVQSSVPETPQSAPIAQATSEAVAPKAPATTSIDPQQVRQLEADIAAVQQTVEQQLAAVRQTVQQLSAGQDQVAHEISGLQTSNQEILEKIPAPPAPRPTAALAHKPTPPPWSRGPMPPYGSPYGPPYQ
jgi:hypothetical protein